MRNPVIDSDFPDPEIIRVGEIYYMVSTTMYFMPGADILRSWDLAHWELVGHVFDLYRAHQDATLIESHALHDLTGPAESPVPLMDVSASVDAQGVVHVTAVNLSADEAVSTRVLVPGMDSARVRVRTLSGDIHAHNTFDVPEQVKPSPVEETALRQGECMVTLPPCSVTELTIT